MLRSSQYALPDKQNYLTKSKDQCMGVFSYVCNVLCVNFMIIGLFSTWYIERQIYVRGCMFHILSLLPLNCFVFGLVELQLPWGISPSSKQTDRKVDF